MHVLVRNRFQWQFFCKADLETRSKYLIEEETNESNMGTIRELLRMTSKSGFERFLMLSKVVALKKFGPGRYYKQNTQKFQPFNSFQCNFSISPGIPTVAPLCKGGLRGIFSDTARTF